MRRLPTAAPLILPRGVWLARREDCPSGYEAEILPHLARVSEARITTGYRQEASTHSGYTAYFQVNVHAPAIWAVFSILAAAILPDVAAPLVGLKGEEPVKGPYTARTAAVQVFEPYVHSLQHDGYLEFGIIYQYQGVTEAIFVRSYKYLQLWTNQPERVQAVLEHLGAPEVPDLQFVDDYPVVSVGLQSPDGTASWPQVLARIQEDFQRLPPA